MTPKANVQTIGDVVALLADARGGALRAEDAQARWPRVPRAKALKELREDLLDALEHMPVDPRGATIESKWRQAPGFDDLKFYSRKLAGLDPNTPVD